MATGTRTGRTAGTRTGRTASVRTGRTSSAGQGRFARASSASRSQGLRRRRQPKPTGVKKVLSSVLPTAAAKKAAPSSKKGKAGGLALFAAAAGMALKNRDKLSQMRHKDTGSSEGMSSTSTGANNSPMPPTTPPV